MTTGLPGAAGLYFIERYDFNVTFDRDFWKEWATIAGSMTNGTDYNVYLKNPIPIRVELNLSPAK